MQEKFYFHLQIPIHKTSYTCQNADISDSRKNEGSLIVYETRKAMTGVSLLEDREIYFELKKFELHVIFVKKKESWLFDHKNPDLEIYLFRINNVRSL